MIEKISVPKLLREVIPAQVFSITVGIIAGTVLATIVDRFSATPGLFVLLPCLYGLANDIDGELAARISSALHMGIIEPKFTYSRNLSNIVLVSFILSSIAAIFSGFIAHFFSLAFGMRSAGVSRLVLISLLSSSLSRVISIPMTTILTLFLFRKGVDPCSTMGPILTSYDDVLTISSIYLTTELLSRIEIHEDILTISTIAMSFTCFLLANQLSQKRGKMEADSLYKIRKIFLESMFYINISLLWTAAGGLAIERFEDLFINNPSLLLMLPPLSDLAGDFGCIICSRLSTALHIGRVQPKFSEIYVLKRELMAISFTGFISSIYLGLSVHITSVMFRIESIELVKVIGLSLIAVMMLVIFQIFLSLFVSFVSFAKGLDPDNITIPIVADLGDMGAIIFLIASSMLLGIL